MSITKKPQNSKSWRDSYYHKLFGLKAAKEAERVLTIFEKECPNDDRPRRAIARANSCSWRFNVCSEIYLCK